MKLSYQISELRKHDKECYRIRSEWKANRMAAQIKAIAASREYCKGLEIQRVIYIYISRGVDRKKKL